MAQSNNSKLITAIVLLVIAGGIFVYRFSTREKLEPVGPTSEFKSEATAALEEAFGAVASKGWKDAHTTSGGIALDEIDPRTLESRLVPGLYAAGEALDIDGPCGGYSLTWAFASGCAAGSAAARKK